MLDATSIMVLTVSAVEALKRWRWFTWVDGQTAPIAAGVLAGLFNLLNAPVLTPDALFGAFKSGIVIGLTTTGMYAALKAILNTPSAWTAPAVSSASVPTVESVSPPKVEPAQDKPPTT